MCVRVCVYHLLDYTWSELVQQVFGETSWLEAESSEDVWSSGAGGYATPTQCGSVSDGTAAVWECLSIQQQMQVYTNKLTVPDNKHRVRNIASIVIVRETSREKVVFTSQILFLMSEQSDWLNAD